MVYYRRDCYELRSSLWLLKQTDHSNDNSGLLDFLTQAHMITYEMAKTPPVAKDRMGLNNSMRRVHAVRLLQVEASDKTQPPPFFGAHIGLAAFVSIGPQSYSNLKPAP